VGQELKGFYGIGPRLEAVAAK